MSAPAPRPTLADVLREIAHDLNNAILVPYLLLSIPLPTEPAEAEDVRQRLLCAVERLRQLAADLAARARER